MARRGATYTVTATVALCTVALLAPTVAAAPVVGFFDAQPPLTFADTTSVWAPESLLALRSPADPSALSITAASATVDHGEAKYLQTTSVADVADYRRYMDGSNTRDEVEAVAVTLGASRDSFFATVFPDEAGETPLAFTVDAPHLVMTSDGPTVVRSHDVVAETEEDSVPYAFFYELEYNHLVMAPTEGIARATGDFSLYVWDAVVTIESAEGTLSYDTGLFSANDNGVTREDTYTWVVVSFRDATLSFPITEPGLTLYSESFTATSSGTVEAERAYGDFQAGNQRYEPQGEALQVAGNLRLFVTPADEPKSLLPSAGKIPVRSTLGGDLVQTNVVGVPTSRPSLADDSTVAGKALALVSAVLIVVVGSVVAYRFIGADRLVLREDPRWRRWKAAGDAWQDLPLAFVSARVASFFYSLALAATRLPENVSMWLDRGSCRLAVGRWRPVVRDLETIVLPAMTGLETLPAAMLDLARAYAIGRRRALRPATRAHLAGKAFDALEAALRGDPSLAGLVRSDRVFRRLLREERFARLVRDADRVKTSAEA